MSGGLRAASSACTMMEKSEAAAMGGGGGGCLRFTFFLAELLFGGIYRFDKWISLYDYIKAS